MFRFCHVWDTDQIFLAFKTRESKEEFPLAGDVELGSTIKDLFTDTTKEENEHYEIAMNSCCATGHEKTLTSTTIQFRWLLARN